MSDPDPQPGGHEEAQPRLEDTPPRPAQTPPRDEHPSILAQLEERFGMRARVDLHEIGSSGPGSVPREAGAGTGARSGRGEDGRRYSIQGLLGEGGVGSVHRGRDVDLGRDVALKFLHERYRERGDILQRFVEEAQIGGQLQHPGIVPVYELGILEGRPFFAMKMVKGVTLSSKLAARSSPAEERGTFLALFEDICQAVSYAHARGVVHRDLKPANVMIGSFGEVQVVDWGMGKVLPREGQPAPTEVESSESVVSVIETVRTQDEGTRSLVGSIMGTPAYMPREQALGDVDAMDRRSDVFALGAILCEILTGRPPYVGEPAEVLTMAMYARLDGAHERLRACGAEPDLIELATRCLQADPAARPESAADVARAVHAHLAASEARAHEATLRALTLKRTQKYGVLLTLVIAAGLLASLWFWRAADGERQRAERNLDNFNRLSNVVRLEEARVAANELYPAWPENLARLTTWRDGVARDLREALPELSATLGVLEARATPRDPAELERERLAHPLRGEIEELRGKLESWRRADAVRAGEAEVPEVELDDAALPVDPQGLNSLAWPLIDPDRRVFGREAEGLALARRIVAFFPEGEFVPAPFLDTLAWALHAVGLDEEALATSEAALEAASEAEGVDYGMFLQRMRLQAAAAVSPNRPFEVAERATRLARLERAYERAEVRRFDDPSDAFLHGTLFQLRADIEAFDEQVIADVRDRIRWAERIEELTVRRHAARWREAREALRRADGVTASTLYAAVPVDLEPQVGLVPIGMNPETKLWEFYHLRSAWDPRHAVDPGDVEIPSHANGGSIAMDGRGIVFVLLPGTRTRIGCQDHDPNAPYYDPLAEPAETPVQEVELDPFFLSKHELTQGQWARLSRGETPSWYIVGNQYHGIPVPIADSHPVEQVDWFRCTELMRQHGLALPTEAQWEYGCRAGTTWPYWCGPEAADLEGNANVLDRTASTVEPVWPGGEAWDDTYKGPSPVGTFAPNPFGLTDMLGNVSEWCRDWHGQRLAPPRPGDGLREPAQHEDIRASRGASYQESARLQRASYRPYRAPIAVDPGLGMRAARALRTREV